MENFILIKLFQSFNKFILFYFIYVSCFIHDVIIAHDVMGDYVYEVLRGNEPLFGRWKGQFFFINYVYVTDLMSLGQMLLALIIYYCCHYGLWCYYRTMWVSGGHQALLLWAVIWVWVLVTWPAPHPIYVAGGICQYFYLRMGHWLWLILPLWWPWQYSGPPCPIG